MDKFGKMRPQRLEWQGFCIKTVFRVASDNELCWSWVFRCETGWFVTWTEILLESLQEEKGIYGMVVNYWRAQIEENLFYSLTLISSSRYHLWCWKHFNKSNGCQFLSKRSSELEFLRVLHDSKKKLIRRTQ